MPSLSDLPLEIVQELLSSVLPGDLENFAFASRTIQSLAQPMLKDHRFWISKYSSITNHHTALPIGDVLKAVLTNPRIGYYVRSLHILPVWAQYLHQGLYTPEELDTFIAAAKNSDYITSRPEFFQELDCDYWNAELFSNNEDLLLAITVPLLPGLAELTCSQSFSDGSYFMEMIDRAPHSLSRLANVDLGSGGGFVSNQARSFALDDLMKFSGLPSIERLTATETWASGHQCSVTFRNPSSITDLILQRSRINPQQMSEYLRSIAGLRTFSFSAGPSTLSYLIFAQSSPSLILDALLSQAKLTLHKLTLHGPKQGYAAEYDSRALIRSGCYMGNLREFHFLTELSTDWALLVPANCDFETWPSTTLPELIELLSVKVNNLVLARQLAGLVKGVVAAKKASNLPKLQTLAFKAVSGCKQIEHRCRGLKRSCQDVEIQLTFYGGV